MEGLRMEIFVFPALLAGLIVAVYLKIKKGGSWDTFTDNVGMYTTLLFFGGIVAVLLFFGI
jgi:hypothetical protein